MIEAWLIGLTAVVICLVAGLGLYATRTNWLLAQHKDQIEFLIDMASRQAVIGNDKTKHPEFMR